MFPLNDTIRFARSYANWDGLSTVAITFDVDFAPAYMIENVLGILKRHNAPATFFATHPSEILRQITQTDDLHEVGLHPNLGPNSTQGNGLIDILTRLRTTYPAATGNRFHLLGYSYRDLVVLGQYGFRYDVSTLRFNCPYVLPAWHPDLKLILLSYTWEDGICENSELPMRLGSIDLASPGIKIINFHPMNIYINGSTSQPRLRFLRENPDLLNCPQPVADMYRCQGDGAETVLRDLLAYLVDKHVRLLRVKDLAWAYADIVPQLRGDPR